MPKIDAVFFDLDGTLLDTAPDLAHALNKLLLEYQLPTLSYSQIRHIVSHGTSALLKLGFGITETFPEYTTLSTKFLALYHTDIMLYTQLFPGILSVLEYLKKQTIPWGIVTNKPAWLTEALIAKLEFSYPMACLVSGDTLSKSKPNPEPLWYACELLQVNPNKCVYIGDAKRDIIAGKAAGMYTLLAHYGYLAPEDTPKNWGADRIINQPEQTILWLKDNLF